MVRKCSHCGTVGHNSRTCTNYKSVMIGSSRNTARIVSTTINGGFKLFGVQVDSSSSSPPPLTPPAITARNSCSMQAINFTNISLSFPNNSHISTPSPSDSSFSNSSRNNNYRDEYHYYSDHHHHHQYHGASINGSFLTRVHVQDRKKGMAWTEEEHRRFLVGLEKLGKGDWRGISINYVKTRTPTQVASHAQKYFLRQSILDKKKRRPSLFDMVESNGELLGVNEETKSYDRHAVLPPVLKSGKLIDSERKISSHEFENENEDEDDDDDLDLELTLACPTRANLEHTKKHINY